MNVSRALRVLARPKVFLPVLLAGALLFVALSLGDLGKVLGRVKDVPVQNMALALGAAAAYLLLKGWQLHLLLADLDAHPDWRRFVLAFAVGELAVTFPLGIFAQNWVLSDEERIHFGRSSAATVVMLAMEVVVVLLWLAVVGIPGWPPLQPLAIAALVGLGLAAFGLVHFEEHAQRLADRVRHRKLHHAAMEAMGLVRGLKQLGNVRVLVLNLLLSAAYLGALVFALVAMGHGVGLDSLSYVQASTIYAFALAAILLCGGLFGQIGTVEVIGMSAAKAWGLGYTDGLALMLSFRLAWTGAMWLLNGPVVLVYWRSMRPRTRRERAAESAQRGQKAAH